MNRTVFDNELLPRLSEVHGFARRLCADEHRSSDLVQETMLKAFTYSDSYESGTNGRAWLFQICKNSMINNTRRKKKEQVISDLADDSLGIRWREPEEAALETESFGDEVSKALRSIPADCQTAILLCDVEGYSYGEIAELTETPIGTIRSRIHRGRKMLAGLLGRYARKNGFGTGSLLAEQTL